MADARRLPAQAHRPAARRARSADPGGARADHRTAGFSFRFLTAVSHGRGVAMRYPLEGIRVVDLTVVWSGPGATAFLGDLGAEVIRVEGNNRVSRQTSAKMTKEMIISGAYHGATFPDR